MEIIDGMMIIHTDN